MFERFYKMSFDNKEKQKRYRLKKKLIEEGNTKNYKSKVRNYGQFCYAKLPIKYQISVCVKIV